MYLYASKVRNAIGFMLRQCYIACFTTRYTLKNIAKGTTIFHFFYLMSLHITMLSGARRYRES